MGGAARWTSVLAAVVLVGAYGYRGVTGFVSGMLLESAGYLHEAGRYEEAMPYLARGARGFSHLRAVRRAADWDLYEWELAARDGGPLGADPELLSRAAAGYVECLCLNPASRRPWEGLGNVYHRMEWIDRERRSDPEPVPVDDPWERVGRSGRIALGMIRQAIALAPNWFWTRDQMALTLWRYGLEQEALEATREAARVLPIFALHRFHSLPDLPRPMLDAFTDRSWEALDEISFWARTNQLIDLGRQEWRRGNPERAAQALEEALASPGDEVDRAEARFYLGRIRLAQGDDSGVELLERAAEYPGFTGAAFHTLAAHAREAGRHDAALDYMRRLRWADPSDLDTCLEFAELARVVEDWAAAKEALNWARQSHPADPRAYVALIEIHTQLGEAQRAASILDGLRRLEGSEAEVERLDRVVGAGR